MAVLVTATFFVLFLAWPVQAGGYYLNEPSAYCDANGQLLLSFGNSSGRGFEPSELEVFANTSNEDFGVDGRYYSLLKSTGMWRTLYTWKEFNEIPPFVGTLNNRVSAFVSEDYGFEEKTNYTITVKHLPSENTLATLEAECPKENFGCGRVNTSIKKCFNKDGKFYAYFGLKGLEQYSASEKLDIEKDVVFGLRGEKFQGSLTGGGNVEIEPLGRENFMFKYPSEKVVKDFSIEVPSCKTLTLLDGQKISNKGAKDYAECAASVECVVPADCDDRDPCTWNRCVDNSCRYYDMWTCEPNIEETEEESKDISDVAVPEEKTGLEEPVNPAESKEPESDGITGQVSAGNFNDIINNFFKNILLMFGIK